MQSGTASIPSFSIATGPIRVIQRIRESEVMNRLQPEGSAILRIMVAGNLIGLVDGHW